MRSLVFLRAAGIALLPAAGETAPKKEIHAVMAAEEHGAAAESGAAESSVQEKKAADQDEALAEEMDEISGAAEDGADARRGGKEKASDKEEGADPAGGHGNAPDSADAADADGTAAKAPPERNTDKDTDDKNTAAHAVFSPDMDDPRHRVGTGQTAADTDEEGEPAYGAGHEAGHGAAASADRTDAGGEGRGSADLRSGTASRSDTAYGDVTAIDRVTLADGDWAFVEGDERRGWFVDRSKMARNDDNTISYWQLILYNDLGSAQFAEAMRDEAYRDLRYTLQRRVLNVKKNTVRTYEIIAYGAGGEILAESARTGEPAEIRAGTMAEQERDAVKKAARSLKAKR